MAIPAAPTYINPYRYGFTDNTAGGVFTGVWITWSQAAATPAEHGVLQGYNGATYTDIATGAASANVLLWNDLASAGAGYVSFWLLSRNATGDSARVAVTFATQAAPTACADISTAKALAVGSIGTTVGTLTWKNTNIVTKAMFWRVTLEAFGIRISDDLLTWDLSSKAFTGLAPGTIHTARISGWFQLGGTIYRSAPVSIEFLTNTDTGAPIISGPAEVDLGTGDAAASTWRAQGRVVAWALTGSVPDGLGILARVGIPGNQLVDLTGSTSKTGIFDARLQAQISAPGTGALSSASIPVRFVVGGGDTLEWFDGDPKRVGLQIDERAGTIRSSSFDIAAGLRLIHSETKRVHFIMRDLAKVSDPALSSLAFTVRLPGQADGAALLEYRQAGATTETINTHVLPYFDVVADNEFLNYVFDRLREAPGASATEVICEGEVTWTNTGANARTAKPFKVILVDDRNT